MFDAYEIVENEGQETIDGRWVVTKKEAHDGLKTSFKARWCLRGFKENNKPRSDSPTADRLSKKIFYAISANEGWSIEAMDVTSAFLQGQELDRELYVVPPKEANMGDCLWKMKKAVYGLYDASRRFYCEVVEFLLKCGCKTLVGDESFFYLQKNGSLHGCVNVHVDDFQLAGTAFFKKEVSDKIANRFQISKREPETFKFTGVDIERRADGEIILSQKTYTDAIDEITVNVEDDDARPLSKSEFKAYRGVSGKLQWLAEMSRPDISFDCLEVSCHNKDAQIKDIKNLNKVVKKAKANESQIRFSKLGNFEELKVLVVTDGAYLKLEDKTKSVMGRFVLLSNMSETKVSPLSWKSKSIPTVCKSAKDAETRAADKAIEDGIYVARCIKEVYTGKRGEAQIPLEVVTDSQPLVDSVNSSKQIDNKLLRPIIKFVKQLLDSRALSSLRWCDTKVCIADMLTKKGSPLTPIAMEMIRTGKMIDLSEREKIKWMEQA